VQQRGVLLVGLDRGFVLVESREPAIDDRHPFLEVASRLMVLGQALLGPIDDGRGLRQRTVDALLVAGHLGDSTAGRLGGRIQFLQGD
jgi:hypothetical protein